MITNIKFNLQNNFNSTPVTNGFDDFSLESLDPLRK